MKLRLERRAVADLKRYAQNSKVHPTEQVQSIVASIQRFGFNDPIGITEDGTIVEGEGRLLAAQILGMEMVEVLVLEDMTEHDADCYRIAHNKIALSTGFDYAILVETLRELTGSDIMLSDMGFSDAAASSIFGVPPQQPVDAPTAVSGKAEEPTREFIIIWDSEAQKTRFDEYVARLRGKGESVGAALARVIEPMLPSAQEEHLHEHQ